MTLPPLPPPPDASRAVAVSPATAATTTTGYGQCAAANSPYKVELSRVIERRSEYCWTIRAAACTPGPANGNRCCGDVPDTFVLRGLGEVLRWGPSHLRMKREGRR